MQRVSSNASANDMNFSLRAQEVKLNQAQNQMSSQQRIQNLRDDPVAAAHASRWSSWAARLDKYDQNALEVQQDLRIQESHLTQANDILQRVNELAIQGANGTYSPDDLKVMGGEIDQYLNELVSLGNAKGPDGRSLFAGTKLDSDAFRVLTGHVAGGSGQLITGVEYTGNIGKNQAEVSEGSTLPANFPGNQVFWADQQQVYSAVDSQNYTVPADAAIVVDGQKVALRAGDTVHAVMAKINSAAVAVKASLDPTSNGVVLQTTQPHQLFLEDAPGSSVLKDLGLVSSRPGVEPPHNLHPDARTYGGSVFDAVIRLRDDLLAGRQEPIGGQGLAGIQASLKAVQTSLADLGARDERLTSVSQRLENEHPKVIEKLSNAVDLDLTEGITQMKMLDTTHQAALRAAAKILPPTLMDYLR